MEVSVCGSPGPALSTSQEPGEKRAPRRACGGAGEGLCAQHPPCPALQPGGLRLGGRPPCPGPTLASCAVLVQWLPPDQLSL